MKNTLLIFESFILLLRKCNFHAKDYWSHFFSFRRLIDDIIDQFLRQWRYHKLFYDIIYFCDRLLFFIGKISWFFLFQVIFLGDVNIIHNENLQKYIFYNCQWFQMFLYAFLKKFLSDFLGIFFDWSWLTCHLSYQSNIKWFFLITFLT